LITTLSTSFDSQVVKNIKNTEDYKEYFNYSLAPTLPSFCDYSIDHFEWKKSLEEIISKLAKTALDIGFIVKFDFDRCELELTFPTPHSDYSTTIILVSIYRDIKCGHVISFSRNQGRYHYLDILERLWNNLHNQGIIQKPMRPVFKMNHFQNMNFNL